MTMLLNIKVSMKLSKNQNYNYNVLCHNPSLGLTTKARACKGVGQ